jgi:hypothetical protein
LKLDGPTNDVEAFDDQWMAEVEGVGLYVHAETLAGLATVEPRYRTHDRIVVPIAAPRAPFSARLERCTVSAKRSSK